MWCAEEFTENQWDDAETRDSKACKKSEHRKHDIGVGKSAGEAEHSCHDVRNQNQVLPAKPENKHWETYEHGFFKG